MPRFRLSVLAVAATLLACHAPPKPVVDAGPPPVISEEILVRPVQTSQAEVEHVLIGWNDLAPMYRGTMDARARARDQGAAEAVVRSVVQRAKEGEPFEQLMKEYSDDIASAQTGGTFVVRPNGQLEPELQALALRLHVGEIGVCKTAYGYHVVKRVK